MATHAEIEGLEAELIVAETAAATLLRTAENERRANGGVLLRDNSDHWGTVGVNARVLRYRLEVLLKRLGQRVDIER